MDIAVVIPCYNEEITIRNVIEDYKKLFKEIYVIDNNSTDNTAKIAKECGATVINEYIQGKGAAIRTAFKIINSDIVVLVDGDSTYSAQDSFKLAMAVHLYDLDMAVGNRMNSGYFKKHQIIHGIGNKIFSIIASIKYRKRIEDLLSGSRALSYDFYKHLTIEKDGFEIETELTKKCERIKYIDIGYSARPKNSHSSIHTIKDGIKILFTI